MLKVSGRFRAQSVDSSVVRQIMLWGIYQSKTAYLVAARKTSKCRKELVTNNITFSNYALPPQGFITFSKGHRLDMMLSKSHGLWGPFISRF